MLVNNWKEHPVKRSRNIIAWVVENTSTCDLIMKMAYLTLVGKSTKILSRSTARRKH
jgi:hypothetical protein